VADKPVSARQKGWLLGCGLLLGLAAAVAGRGAVNYTSTDTFCNQACHAHPHATEQWIQSGHYANKRGVVVHCTDCHLPPDGIRYLTEKARLGAHDAYGQLFRDVSKIDWARERKLDRAVTFTYDDACVHCHSNLFGQGLSQVAAPLPAGPQQTDAAQVREMKLVARRMEAHLYYQRNRDRLHCVNCHLFEGHLQQKKMLSQVAMAESPEFPLNPSGFQNYTEVVPGSTVKFHMIAVPAGELEMGSPELGACRQRDSGPPRAVHVNPFRMAQATVTKSELEVFYAQRKVQAKQPGAPQSSAAPTALTQQVAKAYTEWLSHETGKQYRLPTEAELEYACIAGGTMPAWKVTDSRADSHLADPLSLNPWGFLDLPGSSTEFSLDYPQNPEAARWYSDRSGVSFRVVREAEESKPTHSAGMQSLRR
jgi:formylglycine-generating enzyme